jgi:putative transposase
MAFIDEHRSRFGVEPICRVLREHDCGIAPNTYWVAKQRPPSARALRDVELVAEVHRVFVENLFVYGADKIWTQLNREEIRVARCAVERLMRAEGLCGARRGRATTGCTGQPTWLMASFGRRHLTGFGLRTWPTSKHIPGGCMSRSSSTSTPG